MFCMEQKTRTPEFLFGQKVADIRKQSGLSQKRLAEQLTERGMPVDASAVSRLESGDRALPLSEVYIIAEVLGNPVRNLMPNMPSPRAEMNMARRAADRAWLYMGDNAASLVVIMADIMDRLAENNELLAEFVSRDGKKLDSPSAYLDWVTEQVSDSLDRKINSGEFSVDNLAFVETQVLKDYYLDSLRELIAPFISVGVHPDLREGAAWRQESPDGQHGEHQAEA